MARTAPETSLVNTPAPSPYAVELAYAIAVVQSSAVRYRDRGSEQLLLVQRSGRVDAVDDGRRDQRPVALPAGEQPGAVVDCLRIAASTRRASASLIRVPSRVSWWDGSPIGIASTFGTSASRKSPWTRGWVMTRCTEMHTWPALM